MVVKSLLFTLMGLLFPFGTLKDLTLAAHETCCFFDPCLYGMKEV